ncbi:DUF3617 domain-containing protein [Bradyrhizobium sp.]|uniref:DUF3617 domain-containing protein n=1 Tax=Bradyrhizobium sp. TaxID=376 RepID=UPI003C60D7F5
MRENSICLIAIAAIVVLLPAAPSRAAESLSRKPGQWEVKTSIANAPTQLVRQCIDAATDEMLQSSAGPFNAAACPQRNVQRLANETSIDSVCTFAGKPATAHAVVVGSLDSAYTMTVTARSEALPGGAMTMTMEAKWLGPCTADQKPGDIVLSNGTKINVPDALQRMHLPTNPINQR